MLLSRMMRAAVTSAVVFAGVAVGGATPAQAAYPTTSFNVTYGNSYVKGTVTWYNRSVGIRGNLKTTEGNCRSAMASAFADDVWVGHVYGSEVACSFNPGDGSKTIPISGTINTGIPGGADTVEICLWGTPADDIKFVELTCKTVKK